MWCVAVDTGRDLLGFVLPESAFDDLAMDGFDLSVARRTRLGHVLVPALRTEQNDAERGIFASSIVPIF